MMSEGDWGELDTAPIKEINTRWFSTRDKENAETWYGKSDECELRETRSKTYADDVASQEYAIPF